MKIFEENGKIRIQLMHLIENRMLIDITLDKEHFIEFKKHFLGVLSEFDYKSMTTEYLWISLTNLTKDKILFQFIIKAKEFSELKQHIIKHLENYNVGD